MKIFAKFDIRKMQCMNIFEKVIGMKAKYCLNYNSAIVFTVPKGFVTKAIGKEGINTNKLASKLNRKIKIIANPTSQSDLENFVRSIVFPHNFRKLSFNNHELTIETMPGGKAALIGKGKVKLQQLSLILEQFFGIKKVIIK